MGELQLTVQDEITWISNLIYDLGDARYSGLWHYAEALQKIKDNLISNQEKEI